MNKKTLTKWACIASTLSIFTGCSTEEPDITSINRGTYIYPSEREKLISLANSGSIKASIELSDYYLEHTDDKDKSIFWLRKAAEQGDAESQYNLSVMLTSTGESVPIWDQREAGMWLEKSANAGYKPAINRLKNRK